MKRRHFIKLAGASPLIMMAPGCTKPTPDASTNGPAPETSVAPTRQTNRVLVLIELKGGNDGLNTVIPYSDDAYYRLRPQIGIARDKVLSLNDNLGLNPVMDELMSSWAAKDMAVIQGVGYNNPNRSHFKSIEIWETAFSDDDEPSDDGWLVGQLKGNIPSERVTDAIAVGQQEIGPLKGALRTLTLEDPERMVQISRRLGRLSNKSGTNDALAHILRTQSNLLGATERIEARLKKTPKLKHAFPKGKFGEQMQMATRLIASGMPVMVLKVTLGGFDTHAGQLNRQGRLLKQLSQGLAAMRTNLIEQGQWSRTLVMTYSEFGRRPIQNGSKGTDHGTAAPQFMLGGAVKGGIYGKTPSLTDLANQDLKHHVDFRQVYATITNKWWGLPAQGPLKAFKPLDFVKT